MCMRDGGNGLLLGELDGDFYKVIACECLKHGGYDENRKVSVDRLMSQ